MVIIDKFAADWVEGRSKEMKTSESDYAARVVRTSWLVTRSEAQLIGMGHSKTTVRVPFHSPVSAP